MNIVVPVKKNDEVVLLFSHQTSSMKLHLTETHGDNFSFLFLKKIILKSTTLCCPHKVSL